MFDGGEVNCIMAGRYLNSMQQRHRIFTLTVHNASKSTYYSIVGKAGGKNPVDYLLFNFRAVRGQLYTGQQPKGNSLKGKSAIPVR